MLIHEGSVAQRAATSHDLSSTQPSATQRLIFVTNRGPIEHSFDDDGLPLAQQGAGGVVSGLLCAAQQRAVSWISVAMSEADRALASEDGSVVVHAPAGLEHLTSRLVYIPDATYHRYYDGISNCLLWFAQHGMAHAQCVQSADIATDWDEGYVAVNAALADAVVAELDVAGDQTPVMFHDYHLYLAPKMVRDARSDARLQHFIHIPWPAPDEWDAVPDDLLRAIYTGLLANDVVGFQTPRDARNFLNGVERYLPGAMAAHDPDEVYWQGHRTLVHAYPIAVTPDSVRADAESEEAVAQVRVLRDQLRLDDGRKLIVRVDRVEPTKNIVRGFQAYERLLHDHPEWRGRVTFLALLVPSRESVREYREYADRVRGAIERVNAQYATPDWEPIVAIFGNDRARALACMRDYDVLLVNSLADGMNLVVKEGGLVNTRDGVVVLSERAGAHAQLHGGALSIDPTNVRATAQALYEALGMPGDQRAHRARHIRAVLERENATSWLQRQLADLLRVTSVSPARLSASGVSLRKPEWMVRSLGDHRRVTFPIMSSIDEAIMPMGRQRGLDVPSVGPIRRDRAATIPLPRERATDEAGAG